VVPSGSGEKCQRDGESPYMKKGEKERQYMMAGSRKHRQGQPNPRQNLWPPGLGSPESNPSGQATTWHRRHTPGPVSSAMLTPFLHTGRKADPCGSGPRTELQVTLDSPARGPSADTVQTTHDGRPDASKFCDRGSTSPHLRMGQFSDRLRRDTTEHRKMARCRCPKGRYAGSKDRAVDAEGRQEFSPTEWRKS
jgi:hypothetical protein